MKYKYVRFDNFNEANDLIDICIQQENGFKQVMRFVHTNEYSKEKIDKFILYSVEMFDQKAVKYGFLPEEPKVWDMRQIAKVLRWDQ